MSKVLITGGAGFIGYFITKELLVRGDEVIIYDAFVNYASPLRSHYSQYLNIRLADIQNNVRLIRGDVRHRGCLVRALKGTKPEIVIHLAAIPIATVSNQFSEGAIEINLNGTTTVIEAIRVADSVKRFIYASSSFVYGNFKYTPADEKHSTSPIDIYGGTKLSGEILTKAFSKRSGIEYVIVRPSAVYGPTDANRRVTQIFLENALQGAPLTLHNGGLSKLDFTYVTDTAHGFVLAAYASEAKDKTFNITRGEGRSLKELVEILQSLIPDVKTIEDKPNEVRPVRGALDISKAKTLLGYEPKYSLEEGMKLYLDFVKKIGIFGRSPAGKVTTL